MEQRLQQQLQRVDGDGFERAKKKKMMRMMQMHEVREDERIEDDEVDVGWVRSLDTDGIR